MTEHHTPDPEFVNRLEWQLDSVMRRQASRDGRSSALRLITSRLGATLALAVVSMFVGGAGTYAAIHRADGQAAGLYIARGEALLEIARTQSEHFARVLARTDALFQQGSVNELELRQDEAQFVHAESETEVRELELAETRITGKEPNDALSERGLVSGTELRAVEAQLQVVNAHVELADLELRILEQKLDGASE